MQFFTGFLIDVLSYCVYIIYRGTIKVESFYTLAGKEIKYMVNTQKEVVPGLTVADVKEIADQVFRKTDGNHPQLNKPLNGFMDILQNGKPNISASPVFIRKVNL